MSDQIVIGPWMEALIWRYRIVRPVEPARRRWMSVTVAVLLAIAGCLAPFVLRLDRAAYPSEPEKQRALELCGREDPTFVRFFAADRAACYERFPKLAHTRAAD